MSNSCWLLRTDSPTALLVSSTDWFTNFIISFTYVSIKVTFLFLLFFFSSFPLLHLQRHALIKKLLNIARMTYSIIHFHEVIIVSFSVRTFIGKLDFLTKSLQGNICVVTCAHWYYKKEKSHPQNGSSRFHRVDVLR